MPRKPIYSKEELAAYRKVQKIKDEAEAKFRDERAAERRRKNSPWADAEGQ